MYYENWILEGKTLRNAGSEPPPHVTACHKSQNPLPLSYQPLRNFWMAPYLALLPYKLWPILKSKISIHSIVLHNVLMTKYNRIKWGRIEDLFTNDVIYTWLNFYPICHLFTDFYSENNSTNFLLSPLTDFLHPGMMVSFVNAFKIAIILQ